LSDRDVALVTQAGRVASAPDLPASREAKDLRSKLLAQTMSVHSRQALARKGT